MILIVAVSVGAHCGFTLVTLVIFSIFVGASIDIYFFNLLIRTIVTSKPLIMSAVASRVKAIGNVSILMVICFQIAISGITSSTHSLCGTSSLTAGASFALGNSHATGIADHLMVIGALNLSRGGAGVGARSAQLVQGEEVGNRASAICVDAELILASMVCQSIQAIVERDLTIFKDDSPIVATS